MSCNIQYKWCKAEATNYEFGKHIFMPASDRIISKVSIWILDYPFSQHPRFESRVVTKQRRNCCKMLLTLECFGRILISNKSLLSSRIYRQATEFWMLAMMLIIRIRTENWTEKTFLEGRHVFALLLSGTWLLLPVKPLGSLCAVAEKLMWWQDEWSTWKTEEEKISRPLSNMPPLVLHPMDSSGKCKGRQKHSVWEILYSFASSVRKWRSTSLLGSLVWPR